EKEKKYKIPIFVENFDNIVSEADIQSALQVNILVNLNVVLKNEGIIFSSPSSTDMACAGISDFFAKKGEEDTILIIEAKKKKILPIDHTPPVSFFQDCSKANCVISQTYTYMIENNLRYGIISTYDCN